MGAHYDDDKGDYSGSAYVFVRSGATWTQQAKLLASDGAAGDEFGDSVSLSGDTALVSAFGDDNKSQDYGSAYVFVRSGAIWTEEAKLIASDGAKEDRFGDSVSLSGDSALVSASGDDNKGQDSGSAYVFLRTGASWAQEAKLLASDGAAKDFFGCSVSIGGDTALVGARYDDDKGGDSGSAYVFRAVGQSCKNADECQGSPCVDGFCCNSACNGLCEACSAQKKGSGLDGICGSVAAGTDPDDECGVGPEQSCDGAGQCKKHDGASCAKSSECFSTLCIDDVCCKSACDGKCEACSTQKKGGGNDGECALVAAGSDPDDECLKPGDVTQSCDGAGGCKKEGGVACSDGSECLSTLCVDGVCCNSACDGPCEACTAAKKGAGQDGECTPVAAGTDPDKECLELGSPASCSAGIAHPAPACNGQGECVEQREKPCTPYACGPTGCKTSCKSADDCVPASACDKEGRCVVMVSCDGEHTLSKLGGGTTDCSPYRCVKDDVAGDRCLASCTSGQDCVAGFVCTSAGRCETPPPRAGPEAGCGCRIGGSRAKSSAPAWLAVALLGLGLGRARRAARR
ncbi:MAG: hypothetical protein HY744_09490 [Deltaproteobacteria bacterium]|nr:hypothetical protein [Deltaproteobacteria bacterium]